jgi:hypothetical protein
LQCKEATFNSESFLAVLRSSDSILELEALQTKVDVDIARQRSRDSGGEDGEPCTVLWPPLASDALQTPASSSNSTVCCLSKALVKAASNSYVMA